MRRESREKVFQTLFLMDALGVGPDEAIPLFHLLAPPAPDPGFYRSTLDGFWENREEVDGLIRSAAENWRLERMAMVDRSILRLGAYEIRFALDVPFAVAINEAVDLGKRYGSEESGAFVNGILDRISVITKRKGAP